MFKNRDFLTWLKAAGIRAIKTFAQTAASLVTVGKLVSDIDWKMVLSASAVAAVYSLLTSLAGIPEVPETPEIQATINVPKEDKE